MESDQRSLTNADKEEVFRIATKTLPIWYSEAIKGGLSDAELTKALECVLGIFGSSYGPGRLDVTHQASRLKIWGGWHIVNHHAEPALFQGARTLAMARHIYSIPNPDDNQLSLL